jgi:hypothetical protein
MIAGGENCVAVHVEIVVGFTRNQSPDFGQDNPGIIAFARDLGDGFETRTAKAGGLESLGSEAVQDVIRNGDLVAPAWPFVELPLGNAAAVVSAAKRASFIVAEAKKCRFCRRRSILNTLGFHGDYDAYTPICSGDVRRSHKE